MRSLLFASIFVLTSVAAMADSNSVYPYSCQQLEAMPNSTDTICRLAELGDVSELKKRLALEPALADTICTVNARYYAKKTVNNTLFTLVLAARDFWDFQDLNIFRQRHYPAVCHPEIFKFRVDELEATGVFLSQVIDPNATHDIGGYRPPYAKRTNIKTLCSSSVASGNQYIPHSKALDVMEAKLFERGAIFHGYCGADSHPH